MGLTEAASLWASRAGGAGEVLLQELSQGEGGKEKQQQQQQQEEEVQEEVAPPATE